MIASMKTYDLYWIVCVWPSAFYRLKKYSLTAKVSGSCVTRADRVYYVILLWVKEIQYGINSISLKMRMWSAPIKLLQLLSEGKSIIKNGKRDWKLFRLFTVYQFLGFHNGISLNRPGLPLEKRPTQ